MISHEIIKLRHPEHGQDKLAKHMRENDRETGQCRLCSSQDIAVIDRIETPNCEQPVPVCHCNNCGHYSLFPTQYQQQKAFEWDGIAFYLKDIEQRRRSAWQVLDRLDACYRKKNQARPRHFLDAGCAIGLSLPLAHERGMQAVGVEPESQLAEYGRTHFGVDIRHGLLQDIDFSGAGFDLIYCEQVIEHVEQPTSFLLQLKALLAPGGCMYIGVPPVFPLNRLTTRIIRKWGANPWGLPIKDSAQTNIFHDPDEHINVFTRDSLQYLADHSGMQMTLLPLTWSTLSIKRVIKQLLTLGSSPGTYLLTLKNGS